MGTARLILEEAARLLTLFWRVSLPTNGQCTLQCEQVGGDTWTPRLRDATGACVSVSSLGRRALSLGNMSEGGGGAVFKGDVSGIVLAASSVFLPSPLAPLWARPVVLT